MPPHDFHLTTLLPRVLACLQSQLVARALTRKGNALVKQGKLEEAIQIYHKSLTEHRCGLWVWLWCGLWVLSAGWPQRHGRGG